MKRVSLQYPYIWIDTAPCLNTEANVCNEAAIFAARRSAEKVEMQDFERVPWRKFCHDLVVVVVVVVVVVSTFFSFFPGVFGRFPV